MKYVLTAALVVGALGLGLTAREQSGSAPRPAPAAAAQGRTTAPPHPHPTGVARTAAPPVQPAASHPAGMSATAQAEMVTQFCATCHSDRAKAGGLSLQGWTPATADTSPEATEKMIRKLRAGMMPPAGARRPEDAQLAQLASSLEQRMDQLAGPTPNPGLAAVPAAEPRGV